MKVVIRGVQADPEPDQPVQSVRPDAGNGRQRIFAHKTRCRRVGWRVWAWKTEKNRPDRKTLQNFYSPSIWVVIGLILFYLLELHWDLAGSLRDLAWSRWDLAGSIRDLPRSLQDPAWSRWDLPRSLWDPVKSSKNQRFWQNPAMIFVKSGDHSHSLKPTNTRPEPDDIRPPDPLPTAGRLRVQLLETRSGQVGSGLGTNPTRGQP